MAQPDGENPASSVPLSDLGKKITIMTTDVNEAFAAERTAQAYAAAAASAAWDQRVADGKLVPIGNGRFRVNDPGSWDNGEIFQQNSRGVAMPQTGLDTTTGKAALYSAVPAWHGLGSVIPGGISDVDEVLRLGGIDFEVEKRAVRYNFHGDLHTFKDQFVTVRDDTGAALGAVGKVYTPVQNRQGFEFLQDLVDKGDATWESAGAVRDGRRVFISMRLPETVTIDAGGINDEIVPFVAVINSHDGSSPFQCVVTPWRPVCANTERFAVRDARTKWAVRHTSKAMDRIEEARRTLGLSLKYYEKFAEEETQLARTSLELDEFDKLIASLWPVADDATDRQKAAAGKRRDALYSVACQETARLGKTAYAAERAVTSYLDHAAPKRELGGSLAAARATALLEGSDDDIKSRAHQRLMLVNR